MLPLIAFTDDTSGNLSKKWHKFDSWSIMPAGLPRHEVSKLPNIHFCCCSDVASAVEMSEAIVPELKLLERDGIEAYDAWLEQEVIVLAPLMCVIADNPRASELVNHLGGSARRFCRMCMVRKLHPTVNLLIMVLLKVDRDVNPTVVCEKRTIASSLQQIDEIKTKVTQQEKSNLHTRYGIKETPSNPMLTLPGDIFR